jgi:hypothetical protein
MLVPLTLSRQIQYPWYDLEAFNMRPIQFGFESFPLSSSAGLLQTGSNLFAIQVHRKHQNAITANFSVSYANGNVAIGSASTCFFTKGYGEASGQVVYHQFCLVIRSFPSQVFDPNYPYDQWPTPYNGIVMKPGSWVFPSQWVEVFNNASTAINLTGWSATDIEQIPRKWVSSIPNLCSLSLPSTLSLP